MGLLKDIVTRFRFSVENGKLKAVTAATRAAEARLRAATFQARQLSASLRTVGVGFLGIAGVGALTGIIGGLGVGLIQANVEFGNLDARLQTVLGTSEKAEAAMTWIKGFASSTPFQIQGVTNAYIALQRKGIAPTTELMTNLGDVAASNGRTLEILMKGVGSLASSGSTEILENATGLDMAVKGNKVMITQLDGTVVTIDRTAKAIVAYLAELGQMEGVSGGMAKMSATLGGRISNLKDALWQVAVAIGNAGLTDLLKEITEVAIKAAEAIKKWAKNEDNVKSFLNVIIKGAKGAAAALALLYTGKLIQGLGTMVKMLKALGIAGLFANASIFLLVGLVAALVLGIQDLMVFTAGGDSLFGRMLDSQGIDPEPYRESFQAVGESFVKLWEAITEGATIIGEALGIESFDEFARTAIIGFADAVVAVAEFSATAAEFLVWFGDEAGRISAETVLFWEEEWEGLGRRFGDFVVDALAAPFVGALVLMGATWETMGQAAITSWQLMGDAVIAIWTATGDIVIASWTAMGDTMLLIFDPVVAAIEAMWTGMGDTVLASWALIGEGMVAAILLPFNAIAAILNELPDFILDELPEGIAEFAREGITLESITGADTTGGGGGGELFAPTASDRAAAEVAAASGYNPGILTSPLPTTGGAGPVLAGPTSVTNNTTVSVTAEVTVDGSVDMDGEDFEGRLQDASERVFNKIIEDTYNDTAEAAA